MFSVSSLRVGRDYNTFALLSDSSRGVFAVGCGEVKRRRKNFLILQDQILLSGLVGECCIEQKPCVGSC